MNVKKSVEITDAKIQFVSLVDKAANLKTFLITKQQGGAATFQTFGKIVKVDKESHYVTGVVYEPMTADSDDNYMTAAEIEKAAHLFLKNGGKVDIQHSFEVADDVYVVESSVAKSDCEIGGEEIKAGTWLMTIEVADKKLWKAVEKGDITGLSMGGLANYATEETDLSKSADDAEKGEAEPKSETKEGLFKRLGKMLGFDVVEKGRVRDAYERRSTEENFWTAYDSLRAALCFYDSRKGESVYEQDESVIREALSDFSKIITELLGKKEIAKSLSEARRESGSIEKAGKKMSGNNKKKLSTICQSLTDFLSEFDDDEKPDNDKEDKDDEKEEETDMNKDEIQKMIDEAVQKAMTPPAAPEATDEPALDAGIAKAIEAGISKAFAERDEARKSEVEKAAQPKAEPANDEQNLDEAHVTKMITDAIGKALEARGVPTHIDDGQKVEKAEEHYLHGIL